MGFPFCRIPQTFHDNPLGQRSVAWNLGIPRSLLGCHMLGSILALPSPLLESFGFDFCPVRVSPRSKRLARAMRDLAGNAFSLFALTPTLIALFGCVDFKWPQASSAPSSTLPNLMIAFIIDQLTIADGETLSAGSQLV